MGDGDDRGDFTCPLFFSYFLPSPPPGLELAFLLPEWEDGALAKSFPAHTLSPNASFSRNNIRLSQL